MGLVWLHRVLEEGKAEAVLKPHVIQDALADVAKEQNIPELLNAPIAKHLSHCQEVACHRTQHRPQRETQRAPCSPSQQACLCQTANCTTQCSLHARCSAYEYIAPVTWGSSRCFIVRKLHGHELLQVITNATCVALSLRPTYGKFLRYRICTDAMKVEFLDTTEFLKFKEKHAGELDAIGSHACSSEH